MPSGYTHCILAQEFNERTNHGNNDLKYLLHEKIRYFQLGALGPDLAYSQQIKMNGQDKVADKLHYEFTNLIPLKALDKIKLLETSDQKDEAFCFFLGYASHVVADGVIHPFIRDKVGDYTQNKTAHRVLEMRLDVILLNEFSKQKSGGVGLNLNYTNMHDQIRDPITRDFKHISKLFADVINDVHKLEITPENIESWVEDMHVIFAAAESENNQFYANLPMLKKYLFKDISDVIKNKDQDLILKKNEAKGRQTNFLNKDVHFINDCIPMFYNAFAPIALKMFSYIYGTGSQLNEYSIPGINLDTGRELTFNDGNDLDKGVTFWGQV